MMSSSSGSRDHVIMFGYRFVCLLFNNAQKILTNIFKNSL